jgi:LysM repeat protein
MQRKHRKRSTRNVRGAAGIIATSLVTAVTLAALAIGATGNMALNGPASATANISAIAPNSAVSVPPTQQLTSAGKPTIIARPILARVPSPDYRVRSGDTLSSIAKSKYGKAADWPMIYWANKKTIKYADIIYVGQNLRIPAKYGFKPVPAYAMAPAAPVTLTVAVTVQSKHRSTNPRPVTVTASSGSIQSYVDEVYGSNAGCADEILNHESGLSWSDVTIENPSGAYGLPQALPGDKMASAGSDWATDPLTQLRWQLGYVNAVYGGVCNAAHHDITDGTY